MFSGSRRSGKHLAKKIKECRSVCIRTNLQTFTWMLEGEVWHQDSLGNRQLLRPKQVNLMTAGTGNQRGTESYRTDIVGVKNLRGTVMDCFADESRDRA